MDWNAAIEKNREALKRLLAALVAMAGLADGGAGTLPRHLHRAVLRLLRPAEAATRRLIIVAARGVVVTLPPSRPRRAKPAPTILRNGVGTGILMPRGVLLPPPHARSRCRFSTGFRVGRAVHVRSPKACCASRCPASPSGFPSRHRRRPTTRSTPHGLAAGSQHSLQHSTTCRRMPGVSPAGAPPATRSSRKTKTPTPPRKPENRAISRIAGSGHAACGRCVPAVRPAGDESPNTRSTRF
jgi:hypothetical protein